MNGFIGNGLLITKHAQLLVTGTSGNIATENFEVINKVNFPNLVFAAELAGLLAFTESTGIFEIRDDGILTLSATINIQASQAAAEIQLIPEFNYGSGWLPGIPRKKTLTAIKPDQLIFQGSGPQPKGTQIRIWVKAVSGNITFNTETLDPGGDLEVPLPAGIFFFTLNKLTARIFNND